MLAGDFAEAESLLREAIRIDRKHRAEDFDDLTFPLNNLALVRIASGDRREARTLLLEAEDIATAANHIWRAMVSNNLAGLECMERGATTGLDLAGRSLRIAHEQFGENDWRSRRSAITNAYCQVKAGVRVDATDLDNWLASIAGRWGEENLYSQRAIMRIRDIHAELGDSSLAATYTSRLAPWMENWQPRRISNAPSPF